MRIPLLDTPTPGSTARFENLAPRFWGPGCPRAPLWGASALAARRGAQTPAHAQLLVHAPLPRTERRGGDSGNTPPSTPTHPHRANLGYEHSDTAPFGRLCDNPLLATAHAFSLASRLTEPSATGSRPTKAASKRMTAADRPNGRGTDHVGFESRFRLVLMPGTGHTPPSCPAPGSLTVDYGSRTLSLAVVASVQLLVNGNTIPPHPGRTPVAPGAPLFPLPTADTPRPAALRCGRNCLPYLPRR